MLSDRIRANTEASPWVIKEVEYLERKLATIREQTIDDVLYYIDHNIEAYGWQPDKIKEILMNRGCNG